MVWRLFSFLLLFLLLSVSHVWSAFYQWVDENGMTHFTDNLSKVPEAYRGQVEKSSPKEKIEREHPRESPKKPAVLFEQKTDLNGNNKQWWQKLAKKWEEKKRDAEDRIEELQIEIRQLETNQRTLGNSDKERVRLTRLKQAAELRKNVAIRMLSEGLADEATRAGAPLEWLSVKY
ncbi:MAG: DUF4124 domain-containing protein [Nitrospirota bacterium]